MSVLHLFFLLEFMLVKAKCKEMYLYISYNIQHQAVL
jgi:hypothetical protein